MAKMIELIESFELCDISRHKQGRLDYQFCV